MTGHVRGLMLATMLIGPKSAAQITERMRTDGTRWPARTPGGYSRPTYPRVLASLHALEPEFVQCTGFDGPRGLTWRLTPAGEARARAALLTEHTPADVAEAVSA